MSPEVNEAPTLPPVPESVARLLRFIDTHPNAERGDQMSSGAALSSWMAEECLLPDGSRADDEDASAARAVRDALVAVLLAHTGPLVDDEPDLDSAGSVLRDWSVLHPVRVVVGIDGAEIEPTSDSVLGRLAVMIARVVLLEDRSCWARMKICRNPPCHGPFFDQSRNTSRAFNTRACSTQVAMRAYRARKRAALD